MFAGWFVLGWWVVINLSLRSLDYLLYCLLAFEWVGGCFILVLLVCLDLFAYLCFVDYVSATVANLVVLVRCGCVLIWVYELVGWLRYLVLCLLCFPWF